MFLRMRGRILLGPVVLVAAAIGLNYLRPVPAVAATSSVVSQKIIAGSAPSLPWPSTGSAAVGVSGLGKLADSGNENQIPTASVAKVMTALVVMHDKPLGLGQTGPSITVTDEDVQAYQADLEQKQSVVAVQAGEVLTQYQALQAMLIPSGNNIAELLARWDAGSVAAFIDRMNARARSLGLAKSKFADPAGADSATVSTASDLLALAMVAMADPVIAQIVSLPQVKLPVAGVEFNVNAALGQDGIVGIKTGSGLAEGANFLFAATVTVTGHQLTIFGCVMGQPTLENVLSEFLGDMGDEFKAAAPSAETLADGRVRLPGRMSVADAATLLMAAWESDATTVAGMVTEAANMPQQST